MKKILLFNLIVFGFLYASYIIMDKNTGYKPAITQSSIYDTNSDAYKLTQLDVGGIPSEVSSSSDFDRYNKIQALLNEIEISFKPRTDKATISDMTVTAWQELKKNNKPTSLLEILQLANSLDKEGAKAITYAEYLTSILIMTK